MEGEFDSHLKWPLEALIKFKLFHQQEQGDDYESSIELNCSKRLKDGASANCGELIIRQTIIDQYTHNSCLHFKVVGIHF